MDLQSSITQKRVLSLGPKRNFLKKNYVLAEPDAFPNPAFFKTCVSASKSLNKRALKHNAVSLKFFEVWFITI